MAKLVTLYDDFATKNLTKWTWSANAESTTSRLQITPTSALTGIVSAVTYDLASSYAVTRLVQTPNVGNGGIVTTFRVSPSAGNNLGFVHNGSQIRTLCEVGGTPTDPLDNITFSAVEHQWLRIREASGTIFWETSADSVTWKVMRQKANPFAVTAVTVNFISGFSGTEPTPGVAIFDNFNLPKIASFKDDFTSLDNNRWSYPSNGSINAGRYQLVPNTGYGGLDTIGRFDLASSSVSVELVQAPNIGNGTIGTFLTVDAGSGNKFVFSHENGVLNSRIILGGASNTSNTSYLPAAHRFLRFRETSGQVFWETSPDGLSWNVQRTESYGFPVSACMILMSAGYNGTEPAPGVALYDNLNIAPKAEKLRDDFLTNNTSKWLWSSNASVVSGQLNLSISSTYQGIYAPTSVDLTSSTVLMQVVSAPTLGNGTKGLALTLEAGVGMSAQIIVEGSNLVLRSTVSGSVTSTVVPWDAAAHRWWRLRESGGTFYWETSPDLVIWTIRRQTTNPFQLTSVNLGISTGYYGTESSPGIAIVDNFNCAKVEFLQDNFATKDTNKWVYDPVVSVSSGQLSIPCSTSYTTVYTQQTWDLTNSSFGVQLVQPPNVGNGGTQAFLTAEVSAGNSVEIMWLNNQLVLIETANSAGNSTTVPFSPTEHKYLRLREASGTVFWEASPDSTTWTILRQKATTLDFAAFYPCLTAGYYGTEPAPGTVIFDNFNVVTPKVATLTDSFTTADSTKWYYGADSSVSGERLVVTPTSNYLGIYSTQTYDLTSSHLLIEAVSRTSVGNGSTQQFMALRNLGEANRFEMIVESTLLVFRRYVSNSITDVQIPYDAIAHRWWRIREAGGQVYWETSPDSFTWTVRRQEAVTFSITQLFVSVGAGYYGTETSPLSAVFDNLNLPTPRSPRTYYVSASGSDAADGQSAGTSWQTLARVNSESLVPGDVVRLNGGQTFAGGITIQANESGTPNNPIIIESYGTGRATINSSASEGIYVANAAGVTVRNLIFVGSGSATTTNSGICFSNTAIYALAYIRIDNCEVSGFRSGVEIFGQGAGFSNVQVLNSSLHDNRDAGLAFSASTTFNPAAPKYTHDNVVLTSVRAFSNRGDVANTTFASGQGISLKGIDGGTIDLCVAYGNGDLSNASSSGPVGIFAVDSRNLIIQRSASYGNRTGSNHLGGGFAFFDNVSTSTLQYCTIYNNDGSGLTLYQGTDNSGHTTNTIRYNIFWGNQRKVATVGEIYIGGYVVGDALYNNTVVARDWSSNTPPAVMLDTAKSGVTLRNNLLVAGTGNAVYANDRPASEFLMQGNLYFTGGSALIFWGSSYSTLGAWRTAKSQEFISGNATGLAGDPGLVSVSTSPSVTDPSVLTPANSMKLRAGAPATVAGLDLAVRFGTAIGTRDYLGTVLGSPIGIGAYAAAIAESPAWVIDSIPMG